MKRRIITRFACWAIVVASLPGVSRAQDKAERLTEVPDKIVFRGRVIDANSVPLSAASVTLVAPKGSINSGDMAFIDEVATIAVNTDMEGQFEIELSTSDQRFLRAWKFLLIVHAKGFAMLADDLTIDRMLVDLPQDYVLQPGAGQRIRLIDENEKPVAGARICPAEISKKRIPFQIARNFFVTTDADGWATMSEQNRSSIQGIYVQSNAIGNQRIPLNLNGDDLLATALPTGRVNGQIVLPEGSNTDSLDGQSISVFSSQTNQYVDGGPPSFSWQTVVIDRDGRFVAETLAFGFPGIEIVSQKSFPFVPDIGSNRMSIEFSSKEIPFELQLNFKKGREIAFCFEDESGAPLSNINLDTNANDMQLTDMHGKSSKWFPADETLDGQLFPRDALGRHLVSDPFGISLVGLKVDSNGQPEPIRLSRSRGLAGHVIDESGNPVVGAKVSYSYPRERFNESEQTLTDTTGRFMIHRLPPNVGIEISAFKDDLATDPKAPINIAAGDQKEIELVVRRKPMAAVIGRIIDAAGAPIKQARVSILRTTISEKEGYGAEKLAGSPLDESSSILESDAEGMFRHPPFVGFDERLLLKIEAEGFLPSRLPFIDGSRFKTVDGELSLGDFQLLPIPKSVTAVVQCINEQTREPIAGADVVFISVHAGRQSASTKDDGQVTLKLVDTSQIVAARAPGYRCLFSHVERIPSEIVLAMQPVEGIQEPHRLVSFNRSRPKYLDIAKTLFAKLDVPGAKESSFYRQYLYFNAQATVDFEGFRKTLLDVKSPYEHRSDLVSFLGNEIFQNSPRDAIAAVKESNETPDRKAMFYAHFAFITNDSELKDELYGEAVVELGRAAGEDKLVAVGALASYLVLDNRVDAAKSVMQDAWDGAKEFKTILVEGKRQHARAAARFFVRGLAIIDLDSALALLPLIADQREVEMLTGESLALLSITDPKQFEAVCTQRNLKINPDGLAMVFQTLQASPRPFPYLADWANKMGELLPDSASKVQLFLFAARHKPSGEEREKCLAAANSAWEKCQIDFWYFWSDPAKSALEELKSFESLSAADLDSLVFTCLNKAPGPFDTYHTLSVLGNAARLMALRDPKLAKALLEPAFSDCVWLFDPANRTTFERNLLLQSAVWVDPNWARELVQQLSDQYAVDDPVRKLQMFCGVIAELDSTAPRK